MQPPLDATAKDSARRGLLLAGALGVALVIAGLAVPVALSRWWLTPDVIEYMAIANAWVHGAGFVDPVRWSFFLDATVPQPAFAVRSPALPVLISLPLALGADIGELGVLHALFAATIGGALALVARRSMGTTTAIAAALLFGLSPAWLRASVMVLSEVTGVAMLLLVIATAPGVLRSIPGALVCAAATLLAWTARPNLLALFLAVAAAVVVELGPRRALRHGPLWAYLCGLGVLFAVAHLAVVLSTGIAPYAGYGVAREIFSAKDAFAFQKPYVGAWTFAQQHADAIAARMAAYGARLFHELCVGKRFHFVGWLLVPGLIHSLRRRGGGAFEQRIAALAGVGFAAITLAYFAAFDPWRYPVFTAVCAVLAGMAWVDSLAKGLAARLPTRGGVTRIVRAAPLAACVLLLGVFRVPAATERALASWHEYREHGTVDGGEGDAAVALARFCKAIGGSGRVASTDPWNVVLYCGQAAVRTPPDLVDDALRTRFIRSERIRYFVGDRSPVNQWLETSRALRPVARSGGYVLYQVRDPIAEPHPWTPPPPLFCAGRESECGGALVGRAQDRAGG
jgi:hypothetical protein